jgi:flagellar protein FlaG
MDTINPQAGNNVASQFIKAPDLSGLDQSSRAKEETSTDTSSSQQSATSSRLSSSTNSNIEDTQNAKANASEADIKQREESVVEIEQALGDISEFMQNRNTQLAFSVDESTDRNVVTVKDASSGDVIRQIPSEEVLKFAERINELQSEFGSSAGILLQGQA